MMRIEGTNPAIRRPDKRECYQIGLAVALHVIGSLMPIWAMGIYVLMFAKEEESGLFRRSIADGQLLLLAAGLVAGSFYCLFKDVELHKSSSWRHPYLGGFAVLGLFLIIVSTTVFSMNLVTANRLLSEGVTQVAPRYVIIVSLCTYTVALVMSMVIELIQLQRESYRPREMEQQRVDNLEGKVRELRRSRK